MTLHCCTCTGRAACTRTARTHVYGTHAHSTHAYGTARARHACARHGTRTAHAGEPQFLVKWKGFSRADDSWEPWSALVVPCALMLRHFHAACLASGELRPLWAAACPQSASAYEVDAELPNWRVHAKRTSAGREYRVFFGPFGEHLRSRVSAVQLASLYAAPEAAAPGGGVAPGAAGVRGGSGEGAAGTNAEAAVVAGSSG